MIAILPAPAPRSTASVRACRRSGADARTLTRVLCAVVLSVLGQPPGDPAALFEFYTAAGAK